MARSQNNPLRVLTDAERECLHAISRSLTEPAAHVARAKALLGDSLFEWNPTSVSTSATNRVVHPHPFAFPLAHHGAKLHTPPLPSTCELRQPNRRPLRRIGRKQHP